MADHATRPARTRPDRSGSGLRVGPSVCLRRHREHHPHAHPLSFERRDGNLIDQPPDDGKRQHPVERQLVRVDIGRASLHRTLHACPRIDHLEHDPVRICGGEELDRRALARTVGDGSGASLGDGQLYVLDQVVRQIAKADQRRHGVSGGPDELGLGRELELELGNVLGAVSARNHAPETGSFSASSTEPWMANALFKPVMSKIFRILSCVATMARLPSRFLIRFRPSTRTPSPVESRKSTFSMSTTIRVAPPSTRSTIVWRSRGAVYTSISPRRTRMLASPRVCVSTSRSMGLQVYTRASAAFPGREPSLSFRPPDANLPARCAPP